MFIAFLIFYFLTYNFEKHARTIYIFKPFVSPQTNMKEFTVKSVIMGCIMGCLFGAANVYLALKAGLTVSASIPIAVIAITLGRKLLKTTILENNIIQTTGSASESIASGVAFYFARFFISFYCFQWKKHWRRFL